MNINKSTLGVIILIICIISTVIMLTYPNIKIVKEAKRYQESEMIQTKEANPSYKYIAVRGIPILTLEDELVKRASLNKNQQSEVHRVVEELKKHLSNRDYDQVQEDYLALDRLVGNISEESDMEAEVVEQHDGQREEQHEEQERDQDKKIMSLTLDEICNGLTKENLKAQLVIIAEKSYIAPKDIDSYLAYYDLMKDAQQVEDSAKVLKNSKKIKEIIDYYVSFQ